MLLLAGCGTLPPRQPQLTLPPSALVNPLTDPVRTAVLASAYVFGHPSSLQGDPGGVAEALARYEFMTVELDVAPRWIGLDPLVIVMLQRGRAEARAAFGFRQDVPPQQAVDALFDTAAALRAGDGAQALASITPLSGAAGAETAIERLAALPRLPLAAAAATNAQAAMLRPDRGGRRWPF
jgi:hypothetical protein